MKHLWLVLGVSVSALSLPSQAQDFSHMRWKDIVKQAKSEGSVVWYQWFRQSRFRQDVKLFEKQYGIRVIVADGTHNGNFNKFLAERNRSHGSMDVLSLSGDDVSLFKPQKMLIGPLSEMLPDASKLRYTIQGGNSHGYAVAYWGNQTGIAYNPAFIKKKDLPQSVQALGAYMKKHPEMVGFNTTHGGSGPSLILSITENLANDVNYQTDKPTPETVAKFKPVWKWFKSHKGQYVITASNSDSMMRLNGGEFAMVAGWEDLLAALQKEGEVSSKLKFYIPKFKMAGGGNVVAIPKNAPHPAAALLFVHWLTSAKTQTLFSKKYGSSAQNKDASSEYSLIPKSQRQYSSDWPNKPLKDAIIRSYINHVELN